MRRYVINRMIGLVLVAFLTISCDFFTPGGINNSSTKIEITPQSLAGTQWELVSIEVTEQGTHVPSLVEVGVNEIPDEEDYILDFSEYAIIGQFFCNKCRGNYKIIPPDSITIIQLGCTRALCGFSPPIQNMIANSRTFELTQDNLRLFYESDMDGKGSLYFEKMDVE